MKFFQLLLRLRFPVLGVVVLLSLFAFSSLRSLRLEQDVQADLPADDPDVAFYEEHIERFGRTEILLVVIEGPILSLEGLDTIRSLTETLSGLKGVESALSLTSYRKPSTPAEGESASDDSNGTVVSFPLSEDQLPALRTALLEDPNVAGRLLGAEGTRSAIILQLEPEGDLQDFRVTMAETVAAQVKPLDVAPFRLHVTGVGAILRDYKVFLLQDAKSLMALTILLMVGFMAMVTRSIGGVVFPLLTIGIALTWTFGGLAALGRPMGMAMIMVPTLVSVICLSDAIHIMARYRNAGTTDAERRAQIPSVFSHMAYVCFLTSLTTAVGFGTLTFSGMTSMRDVGLASAAGILLGYGLNMVLLPIIFSWGGYRPAHRAGPSISPRMDRLAEWSKRPHRIILWGSVVVCLACLATLPWLQIKTDMASFLPPKAPSIQGLQALEGHLTGFRTLEFSVQLPDDPAPTPETLQALRTLQESIEALDGVDQTRSVADLVQMMQHQENPEAEGFPDSWTVESYLLGLKDSVFADRLNSILSTDWLTTRVIALTGNLSSTRQLEILEQVEAMAGDLLPEGAHLRATGIPKLYTARMAGLIRGQVMSVFLTGAISILIITLLCRSLRAGLAALLPNVLPVVLTMALMSITGIGLNLITLMTSCIAIGLAVDDTMHYLVEYLHRIRANDDHNSAIGTTLRNITPPVIHTSLVISGGFAVLLFSGFPPNRQFGLLSVVALLSALIADVFLLPQLLRIFRPK